MFQPDFLKKGDTIILVSPAGKVEKNTIKTAVRLFESWGLNVKITPHALGEHHRFSGTDNERLNDLQNALDDTSVKAIVSTRGGYGSCRLLEKLDFNSFEEKPKWIVGFSDITALHSCINKHTNYQSIHACMPIGITNENINSESVQSLHNALFGKKLHYNTLPNTNNQFGSDSAELIGGNLAVIHSLLSTNMSYEMNGKILFLEEVGEPIHNIDRMLQTLKLSGNINKIKGLIIGSFSNTDFSPSFGKTIEELIIDILPKKKIPVVFDFPVGHTAKNNALYIGRKAKLEVTTLGGSLEFL